MLVYKKQFIKYSVCNFSQRSLRDQKIPTQNSVVGEFSPNPETWYSVVSLRRRVTLRVLYNAKSNAEISVVKSEPPAELSLTVLLIFIKHTETGKGGVGGRDGRQYAPHAE